MNEVIKYLQSKITAHDKVIVACSGGSDSMGLLYLLISNFNKNNIICAHVNHNVRKQSQKEYKYVKCFCEENGILFEGTKLEKIVKHNFEDYARKFRYQFFEDLLKKYRAKYIITAHHGDDQIETILMRITRGSNLSGYAGIKLEDGQYLRPFLTVSKQEILDYVKCNRINYYEDYTNHHDKYTRNRYRHNIIPFLKKEDRNIHQKYLKYSNELMLYDEFLLKYVKDNNFLKDSYVDLAALQKEHILVKKKVLQMLVKRIQREDILEISDKNIENMLNIINSSKSNSKIDLSNGYIAKKSYNKFEIVKKSEITDYEEIYNNCFENEEYVITSVANSTEKSNWLLRLHSSEIKLPLIVRNRRYGDVIMLKNSGTKKIKDIFIDEKIDVDKRKRYPIVVDSNGTILWLPGLKKSKFDKENNEKCDIILFSERK